MGCSGGLVAEGAGIFAVIRALVEGVGYAPGCTMGTVSPVGLPSRTECSSMGLSAGFHLLGHFRGPIPSVLYSAPPIPAGILQESGHSTGIPVESCRNPVIPVEFQWNPQESTGIPLEFHWNQAD